MWTSCLGGIKRRTGALEGPSLKYDDDKMMTPRVRPCAFFVPPRNLVSFLAFASEEVGPFFAIADGVSKEVGTRPLTHQVASRYSVIIPPVEYVGGSQLPSTQHRRLQKDETNFPKG